ncbi:MAG: T9SS C-terminal target domain-containing protein [Calditrichaeota bacterium]|nr:MAG: T9SS C-terminal target domain-containing protein [Calditrichota bacterium]
MKHKVGINLLWVVATTFMLFAAVLTAQAPITIDAEKDAWYETLTGPVDGYVLIPAAAYNTNGQPSDNVDLSAKLWTAWDETYLYFYEEVKDNVVNLNNSTSYQDDILEMYFDPDPIAAKTSGQIGITMTALDSVDVVDPAHLPGVMNLSGNGMAAGNVVAKEDYARKKVADGYIVEGRVKWEWLKATDGRNPLTPAVGNIFGLAAMNHDNDVAQREGSITWATVMDDAVWNNPTMHGKVEFLADNKLKFSAENAITGIKNPLAPIYEPNNLPEPWLTMDIGAVAVPGSAEVVDGKVKVTGSGADIWGPKDEFRFVFQTITGNVEITANLEELTQSDPWTKGALMIRDALNDSSAHAIIALASANGEAFQWRPAAGKESIHTAGVTTVLPPKWLKLIRIGDVFSGFTSVDAVMWDFIGRATVPMTNQVYVGMAVTSHLDGALSTATYSGIEVKNEAQVPELNFEMVIDAVKDPWYNYLMGPDNGYVYMPAATYNTNGQPDNNADLSASLWTAWDENYLYIYEEVKDNVVNLNNVTSWQDDVLEVYIDPNPTAAITQGQIGFHLTALDSADADPAALAGVINLQGYNLTTGATTEDYARAKVTGGYVLECRVKWDVLKDATRAITPAVGTVIGMATMNHDNDVATREGSISWATVLNDNVWSTPANHGTVEFLPGHQLKLTAKSSRDTTLVNALAPLYAPASLPADWLTMNLGTVPAEGSAVESSGTWTVAGAGADIWGVADAFRFAFQTRSGDIELTAKLESLTKSDPWTKGGLMIRDDLTPGAKHAFIALASDNGEHFQYRPAADGESMDVAGDLTIKPMRYVKIVRVGDVFSGWTSADGKAWLKVGQAEIPMTGQIYVGMAVTAHHVTKTSTAVFSGILWKTKPTAVEEQITDVLPTAFELQQNYPNPFNPTTTIEFALPTDSKVKLTVFDVLGREVSALIDGRMEAGLHHVTFDAAQYASGVYFYRLQAGDQLAQKKMILIK